MIITEHNTFRVRNMTACKDNGIVTTWTDTKRPATRSLPHGQA
jgi:hypothetical protein